MFANQPFTEDKAVINVKTVQIHCFISQAEITYIKKSIRYEIQDLMQSLKIKKKRKVSLKNGF